MSSLGNYTRPWNQDEKLNKKYNIDKKKETVWQTAAYTNYSLGRVWRTNSDEDIKRAISANKQLDMFIKIIKKFGRVLKIEEFKACSDSYGVEYWLFFAIKKDKLNNYNNAFKKWRQKIRDNRRKNNKMKGIKLIKLDMKLAKEHTHPDIKTDGTQYLIKYNKGYFAGTFSKVWFGLSFDGWLAPLQFDAPGSNHSRWKNIWEIKEVN